jgi:hypothetical protein
MPLWAKAITTRSRVLPVRHDLLMSEDETRAKVPGEEILRGQMVAPLPEGTAIDSAFLLVKLDDGEWCARSIGDSYNRLEFLGQLVAYTRALTQDEAEGWFLDE